MFEKLLLFLHENEYALPFLLILGVLLLFINAGIYFRYIAIQKRSGEDFWDPKLLKILLIEIALSLPLGIAMTLAAVADGSEISREEMEFMKPMTFCWPILWIMVLLAATRRGQASLNPKREREQQG